MATFAAIKNSVAVHTAMDKETKKKLMALSRKTSVPQCVYVNNFVTKGLASMPGIVMKRRKKAKK